MSNLVKYETPSLATIDPSDLAGMSITFDRVKVEGSGFEIPNGTDSPDVAKDITGVIVDQHPSSVLWLTKGSVGSPHAYSLDGVTQTVTEAGLEYVKAKGLPVPSTTLADCPYNQWGSALLVDPDANPRAKANKNQRRIYILPSGEMLPLLITLSPASLSRFDDYMLKRIILKGKKLQHVVTKISAERVVKGTNSYSAVNFTPVADLTAEQAAEIDSFIPVIKQLTRREPVTTGETVVEATVSNDSMAEFDAAFGGTTEVV